MKNFISDAFLGVVKSTQQMFWVKASISLIDQVVLKSFIKQLEIGMTMVHSVDPLSPTYAFEVVLTFSIVTFR